MEHFDSLETIVDLGSHFSAHWIFNGCPQIDGFWKQSKTNEKMTSKKRVGKNMILLIDFLCQKRETWNCKKKVCALYILQNMSLLGIVKYREK